jgi:hypothetical protein
MNRQQSLGGSGFRNLQSRVFSLFSARVQRVGQRVVGGTQDSVLHFLPAY